MEDALTFNPWQVWNFANPEEEDAFFVGTNTRVGLLTLQNSHC